MELLCEWGQGLGRKYAFGKGTIPPNVSREGTEFSSTRELGRPVPQGEWMRRTSFDQSMELEPKNVTPLNTMGS